MGEVQANPTKFLSFQVVGIFVFVLFCFHKKN